MDICLTVSLLNCCEKLRNNLTRNSIGTELSCYHFKDCTFKSLTVVANKVEQLDNQNPIMTKELTVLSILGAGISYKKLANEVMVMK